MVIDSSAFLAIFLNEPERERFVRLLQEDGARLVSAGTLLETSIALEGKRGDAAGVELDVFIHRLQIDVVPVDSAQVEIARAAWRRYGKGRHPAGLKYGDCFAYALAKSSGEALLAKGKDFERTDIRLC
jgi:ribonuclease VapC